MHRSLNVVSRHTSRTAASAARRLLSTSGTQQASETEVDVKPPQEAVAEPSTAAPSLASRFDELLNLVASDGSNPKVKALSSDLKELVEEYMKKMNEVVVVEDAVFTASGALKKKFPHIRPTNPSEPYSEQELYVRKLHADQMFGNHGSQIQSVYRPHLDNLRPKDADSATMSMLMAAGCHLGHHKSLWRPSTQPYIYGIQDDIHIIDLNKTLTHLRRAAKVVEGVAEAGGVILFVGTREGQYRSVYEAAKRTNGYYVSRRWIPGSLTNGLSVLKGFPKKYVDMGDRPTDRELSDDDKAKLVKPDLIIVLNPVENRPVMAEAAQMCIPTIGIIDTDSEPSLVTYPIPANDDSIRSTNLICGMLSKAGELGRKKRVDKFNAYRREVYEEGLSEYNARMSQRPVTRAFRQDTGEISVDSAESEQPTAL